MRILETDLGGSIGGEGGPYLEFAFPDPLGKPPSPKTPGPRAILSLRGAGSLRYLGDRGNPLRADFFSSLGLAPGSVVATELHHTRRLRLLAPQASSLPGDRGGELDASLLEGEDFGDGGPDGAGGRDGLLAFPEDLGALALAVTVADCMPIWIHDTASGAYGVLHSGWKGTGILARAVEALERRGSDPAGISVILGPAIGACCYEVDPARAAVFEAEFGAVAVDRSGPRPRLDIRAANLALAKDLGLGALLSIDACTSCEPELGSFRREGPEAFTRMVALCLPG